MRGEVRLGASTRRPPPVSGRGGGRRGEVRLGASTRRPTPVSRGGGGGVRSD